MGARTDERGARSSSTAVLALSVTIVLWAMAFVAIRSALPGFGVAGLVAGRLLVAAIALALVGAIMGVRRPERSDLPRITCVGLVGMTAYQLLLNAGERTVDAGTASVLVNTGPIFTAVLAWLVMGDRIDNRVRLGLLIGFVGAAIIAVSQGSGFSPGFDALLILGAALTQALSFVWQKPLLLRYTGIELTYYSVIAAMLAALPLMPAFIGKLSTADHASVAALIFLGVGPSAIGYVTWSYALARADTTVTANTLYLVPTVAIAGGWLLLGETPMIVTLIGSGIALAGVAISRGRSTPTSRR